MRLVRLPIDGREIEAAYDEHELDVMRDLTRAGDTHAVRLIHEAKALLGARIMDDTKAQGLT